MKNEKLRKILELHSIFINSGGAEGQRANLQDANLRGANLRGANLRGANLWGVSLEGADLRYATGNGLEIKSIQAFCYPITYTSTHMFIGCEGHAIEDWENFTFDEIYKMDGDAATLFWCKWKEFILEFIRKSPAAHVTTENKK